MPDQIKTLTVPNAAIERRIAVPRELRATRGEAGKTVLRGYAAVFNSLSEEIWGFYERIALGAFIDALKTSDARCLLNHDSNFVLGRMSAGTLRVSEDATGLLIENDVPDTQVGRDLVVSIERGDITHMSFAFTLFPDGDSWGEEDGKLIRTITHIRELYDVSPVTYPAYAETSISAEARSKASAMNEQAARARQAAGALGAPRGQVPASVLRRRLGLV